MKGNEKKIRAAVVRKRFIYGMRLAFVAAVALCIALLIVKRTAKPTEATKEIRYKYYTSIPVQQGDSLWSIAEKYITSEYEDIHAYIDEVIQMNQLKTTSIKAGSYLCVPYYAPDYK